MFPVGTLGSVVLMAEIKKKVQKSDRVKTNKVGYNIKSWATVFFFRLSLNRNISKIISSQHQFCVGKNMYPLWSYNSYCGFVILHPRLSDVSDGAFMIEVT